MKNYTIDIFRVGPLGRQHMVRMEFPREHFTSREYKEILMPAIFDIAFADVNHVRHIDAEVRCEGAEIWTVHSDTRIEDAEVRAAIKAARPHEKFSLLRDIMICRRRQKE